MRLTRRSTPKSCLNSLVSAVPDGGGRGGDGTVPAGHEGVDGEGQAGGGAAGSDPGAADGAQHGHSGSPARSGDAAHGSPAHGGHAYGYGGAAYGGHAPAPPARPGAAQQPATAAVSCFVFSGTSSFRSVDRIVSACVCVWVGGCVLVYALRIASIDKILHVTNT